MVARYLLDRFDILADDADIRRHDPEDFAVHFRNRDDRDRVLTTPPGGAPAARLPHVLSLACQHTTRWLGVDCRTTIGCGV